MKLCHRKLHWYNPTDHKAPGCPECLRIKSQLWRRTHRDQTRAYYLRRREHIAMMGKQYRATHKERLRERDRNRHKMRYHRDIQFRLARILRTRLQKALKGNTRMGSAIRDLGCSMDRLKTHIEAQFLPGMTWNNYGNKIGQWSIDHIIALSAVDLTDREQFLRVNNYMNLRPLWNKDQIVVYHSIQKKGNVV